MMCFLCHFSENYFLVYNNPNSYNLLMYMLTHQHFIHFNLMRLIQKRRCFFSQLLNFEI